MSDVEPSGGISESQYKADFELLDRYISFSAELLRLPLAIIVEKPFAPTALQRAIARALTEPHPVVSGGGIEAPPATPAERA